MSNNIEKSISNAASTVASVANEFIQLGRLEPNFPCIDQMKLQKLLFYSHAWYLAIYNKPLFDEPFEAWPWGPVARDVYNETRKYGTAQVGGFIREIQKTNFPLESGSFNFVIPDGVKGEELKAFIKQVWDVHKQYTGIQLSNSTHGKGEPWSIIKETYGTLDHKPVIPNELIATVFKKKLQDAKHSTS